MIYNTQNGHAVEAISTLQPDWPAPENVRAAFTLRSGGVSVGPYASLNLGRSGGDDARAVDENRRRVFAALNVPAEPSWIRQVHGARVVRAPLAAPEPEADACYTTDRNVVCLVQAADCLPVLFCDRSGSVVAAAHAGWRGLAAGVLEATVRALPAEPAELMAWLGPAIGPEKFEVGAEVRAAFMARDAAAAAHFRPGAQPGKFFADLCALARDLLRSAGVTRIYGGQWCTASDPANFFSHRRDGVSARMAALIWLR